MESLYDVPLSNRRAAAYPGDWNVHLNERREIWIMSLFHLFSKAAAATENIYDIPSALLRKIPDYSLGRESVWDHQFAFVTGLSLMCFCISQAFSSEEQRNEEAYWRIWGLELCRQGFRPNKHNALVWWFLISFSAQDTHIWIQCTKVSTWHWS